MIQLSQAAVQEVLRLRSRQPFKASKLRIAVSLGGCLNFSYKLIFDDSWQVDDQIYPCEHAQDIEVIVDAADRQYLDGLVIDYSEDMMGGGFRFYNPSAVQVCGCGNSFSIHNS